MTNREMAIRLAAATIERMLKYDNTNTEETLKVLKAEIEVFDFSKQLMDDRWTTMQS